LAENFLVAFSFLYIKNESLEKKIYYNLIKLILYSWNGSDWNELLVINIQIDVIVWKPTKIFGDQCYNKTNGDCKKLISDFISKLKQLTPNITTTNNPDKIIEWFKDNGGYTNIGDFKTNQVNSWLI
jgi:hypothetical protein